MWTVVSGCVAVGIGLAVASAVLVAFGLVGYVDGVGSAALAYHFRHALRHDALAEHLERLAHRIVIVGLVTVGCAAIVMGTVRLLQDSRSGSTAVGTGLAAVSLVILVILSRGKVRLGARLRSRALRSDGHLSAVGAAQAGVTLLGVGAAAIGWHWADPTAAVVVGVVTTFVGVRAWRSGASGDTRNPTHPPG